MTRLICFFVLVILWSNPLFGAGPDTENAVRTMAEAVLGDATFQFVDTQTGEHYSTPKAAPESADLHIDSRYHDWRYWNGVLNIAMLRLGEILNEPEYIDFSLHNIAFAFDHYRYFENRHDNQNKWSYPFGQLFIMQELDDCGAMGASVIEVYKHTPRDEYREYIEKTAAHMTNHQDRMSDGTFVREFPHEWTLWADDLYMSLAFLSRMGEFSGDFHYFDDAADQVIHFFSYLRDTQTGLLYHNWYSDLQRQGVALWGRANGWALLAQVDLLDHLPENYFRRDTLITLLRNHIGSIARFQSASGLWHQLLDKEDAYLETSCSAMFTYAIARSVNNGYIDPRFAGIAQQVWRGVRSTIDAQGRVKGVCTGTVVSNNLVDYYERPTPLNDIHGIGAVLLAGAEMLRLQEQQSKE